MPTRVSKSARYIVILETFAALVLMAMMFHTVAQVFSRALFSTPIRNTNEIAGYWYLPLIVFAGLVATTLSRTHIEAGFVVDNLEANSRRRFKVVGQSLASLLSLVLGLAGAYYAYYAYSTSMVALTSSVQVWPVLYVMSASLIASGLIFAYQMFLTLRKRDRSDKVEDGAL